MVVPKDHDFCFVGVELQAVDSHPVGDTGHAFVEVSSGGGGVFREGEDELCVVGIRNYIESMGSDDVGQGSHVGIEEGGAER